MKGRLLGAGASEQAMAYALAFNPGSNSLKFEAVALRPGAASASELQQVVSAAIDDVGARPHLTVFDSRRVAAQREVEACDMAAAVRSALAFLRDDAAGQRALGQLEFAAVRVVHGGEHFDRPVQATVEVRQAIEGMEEPAPLHNASSLTVLEVLEQELPGVQCMVAFDTAFHRTLPEVAWRYPVDRELADRFGVRKFGFHGLSHRWMLEEYAAAVGKAPKACTLVTLHLESGCSACAIRDGESVDTTMGLTPLEGLMMGSRSGSVDPALVPFLMKKMGAEVEAVMQVLEKKSGLLGIAGGTLDTRELVKRDDRWAQTALAMFSYRVKLAVGGYLAVLGERCEAVVFGGGIGEDSPWLRAAVCAGLGGFGLELDPAANGRLTEGQGRISAEGSRIAVWGMAVEEGLEMVWECQQRPEG